MSFTQSARRRRQDDDEGIEMTTFKVWGRRLPGGAAEIDREESEKESKLFASFPDGFKTYEDAAKTKVSAEQLKALGEATKNMIARARAMKKDMEDRGEPVDLERIEREVFGHIPRGLIPPEFIKELQSWRRVRDAMTARAVMKGAAPEGRAEKIKGGLDKAAVVAGLAKSGLGAIPGLGKEATEVIEKVNEALEYLGKALEGGSQSIDLQQARAERTAAELSPVAIKIADEKLMTAMTGLAGLGADVVAKFVPVVGALKNGADCLAAIKDTMERTKLRAGTGELRDQALLDTTSQLSRAFDQAQGRETRLAVESGVSATTSGLSTAANVATSTGVGAKVGAALEVTSTAISVGGKVVLGGYDEVTARKAVATLRRAQAGDTDAQQEVFADHAHYAKMLIAVMAMDGDPLARKYLIDRGLEESDLENPATTADLLFDYAVLKSKETDEPSSKIAQALELAQAAGEKLTEFAKACAAGLERIGVLKAKPAEPVPEIVRLPGAAEIRGMWQQVAQVREMLERSKAVFGAPDRGLLEYVNEMVTKLSDLQKSFHELARQTEALADDADKALAAKGSSRGKETAALAERAKKLREEAAMWTSLKAAVEARGA